MARPARYSSRRLCASSAQRRSDSSSLSSSRDRPDAVTRLLLPDQGARRGQAAGAAAALGATSAVAVTDKGGLFTLGLPPGQYVIEAWQEKLGAQTATITVGQGGATTQTLDFTFKPAGS